MGKSEVYFTNLRTNGNMNLLNKLERLVKKAGIENINFKDKYSNKNTFWGTWKSCIS